MTSPHLKDQQCVPCRPGSPPVSAGQVAQLTPQIPEWQIDNEAGIPRLRRVFKFPDFRAALEFTARVGQMADRQDHHPRVVLEWGRAEVTWWTHDIRNLHMNDFICAARTDDLYRQP